MTTLVDNDLKDAVSNLNEIAKVINTRRVLWNGVTKPTLVPILHYIKESLALNCTIQELNFADNYSGVNIQFNITPSGINEIDRDETGKTTKVRAYMKHGGFLTFSQSYNGRIYVIIGYPNVEDITFNNEPTKHLATIEPRELTEPVIREYVLTFLKTMAEWEGEEREPIGFKITPTDVN